MNQNQNDQEDFVFMPRSPDDVLEFFEVGSYGMRPAARAQFCPDEKVADSPISYVEEWLVSAILKNLASRLPWRPSTLEAEWRLYQTPLSKAFEAALRAYPSIAVDPDILAGAPCIRGTRIPVYMV